MGEDGLRAFHSDEARGGTLYEGPGQLSETSECLQSAMAVTEGLLRAGLLATVGDEQAEEGGIDQVLFFKRGDGLQTFNARKKRTNTGRS